jgi:hypothetical protein
MLGAWGRDGYVYAKMINIFFGHVVKRDFVMLID